MKTMTCKQLGGACDLEFHANTFDEIAELSKKHGMEMFQNNDALHLQAIGEMAKLLQSPDGMKKWMDDKKRAFENAPDDQ